MSLGPAGRAGAPMPPADDSPNEVQVELAMPVPHVSRVTLRRFKWSLAPLWKAEPFGGQPPADGIELTFRAADVGLLVSVRFDRSEFVNIATGGLAMLDAADAAESPEGR